MYHFGRNFSQIFISRHHMQHIKYATSLLKSDFEKYNNENSQISHFWSYSSCVERKLKIRNFHF